MLTCATNIVYINTNCQAFLSVLQLPDKDEFSQSKRQMLARIDVCMGGKVAEEVIFGRDAVTSGARSDLQQATSLARHMVTECGMSDELGESSKCFTSPESS